MTTFAEVAAIIAAAVALLSLWETLRTRRKNRALEDELRERGVAEQARARFHELTVQAATAPTREVLDSIEAVALPQLQGNLPPNLDLQDLLAVVAERRETLRAQAFRAKIESIEAQLHEAEALRVPFPERDLGQDPASRQAGINQNAALQDFSASFRQGLYELKKFLG